MKASGEEKIRTEWIDVAKFFAILGVLVDHTGGVLYTSQRVAFMSYYSVGLFILVMGITTFWSMKSKKVSVGRKILLKSWGILRPYLIATFIYSIFIYRSFDLEIYLNHVIHFNISLPFYYVLLYLQLVLISPVIYRIFTFSDEKRYSWLWEIIFLGLIMVVCSLTTRFTNILSVYGGGGKLFGGNFLFLFYIGMWFGKYYTKIRWKKIPAMIIVGMGVGLTIGWWQFMCNNKCNIDTKIPFGSGFNPPSISFCTYAILWAATIYAFAMMLQYFKCRIAEDLFRIMAWLGKHTLYIFLYHRLFMDLFSSKWEW